MMGKIFSVEFQFRPVGQGLFYTGEFMHNSSGNKFRMVYDCGVSRTSSKKYIIDEINNFGNSFRKEKKLDLLIVSHFHEDHYSHIADLLNATNGVKKLIIPYLTPEELYLYYIDNLLNGGSTDANDFFSNPTDFFKEKDVDEIIYIHPNENADDTPPIEGKEGVNFLENFEFNLTNNLNIFGNLPNDIQEESGVSHCYDMGNLNLNFIWEFKFFNQVKNQSQVLKFKNDVVNNLNLGTVNEVKEYFESNTELAKTVFRDLYDQCFGDKNINDTSIVVFHAPINNNFDLIKSRILGRPYFPYRCEKGQRSTFRCGNLLTADIRMDATCLTQIRNKWQLETREDVVYFQIPHHGASGFFINGAFSDFPRAAQFIINFGLGNTNKHPKNDIIDLIINNNFPAARIQLNTQVNHVKIRFDFWN